MLIQLGAGQSSIEDGTIATFRCAPGQLIVVPFGDVLHENNLMAIESTKFKAANPENINVGNANEHGWVDYDVMDGKHGPATSNTERFKNLTLVVPAKMTMSSAEYVCENGAWMRIQAIDNTSALPHCSTEDDVGRCSLIYSCCFIIINSYYIR